MVRAITGQQRELLCFTTAFPRLPRHFFTNIIMRRDPRPRREARSLDDFGPQGWFAWRRPDAIMTSDLFLTSQPRLEKTG